MCNFWKVLGEPELRKNIIKLSKSFLMDSLTFGKFFQNLNSEKCYRTFQKFIYGIDIPFISSFTDFLK
jgi:hypothetical protein